MMAVIGLVNFRNFSKAWRANRDDGVAAILTFVATLAFAPNIQNGILAGILFSLSLLLYRMMRPHVAVYGAHHQAAAYDVRHAEHSRMHPNLSILRFDGALRFMNVSYFEDALLKLYREHPGVKHILIESGGMNSIDASGVEMLGNLLMRFRDDGVVLNFSGLKPQVYEVLDRTDVVTKIGREHIFTNDRQAIEQLNRQLEENGGAAAANAAA